LHQICPVGHVGAVGSAGRPGVRGCRQHPVARRARGLCRVASPPVRNWRASPTGAPHLAL